MRYSEAVKRHKLETKQRILNSILEAAEKERTASPSADNYGFYYETEKETRTKTRETNKKETITMKSSSQLNEVRSRKGGIIAAAACALLVVGGGLAMFRNSDSIEKTTLTPGTSVASSAEVSSSASPVTESKEEPEAKENAAETVTAETAVTADTSSAPETADSGSEAVTSAPETVIPETTTTTAKVKGKTTFNELYESSHTVYMGKVAAANPQTLEMPDGTVKNVIKYTLDGNYFMYDIGRNRIREYHGAETMVLQEVNEGDEAQIKPGETAIFMTGDASLADINGGFVYDSTSHQLFNATYSNDDIALGMRDYMLNVILDEKDAVTVSNWIAMLGEYLDDRGTAERSDLPSSSVTDIHWDSETGYYSANLNRNPNSNLIRKLNEGGQFINILNTASSQKISGFDDVDIDITSVAYNPATTATVISLTATPKNGFEFDPTVVYALTRDYDTSGLREISYALNADATMFSEGLYYPVQSCLTFQIAFDQAGNDGQMEFDTDTTFSFTLNGISAGNGENITGEYTFTYTYDASVLANLDNVKIVTRDTATNNY